MGALLGAVATLRAQQAAPAVEASAATGGDTTVSDRSAEAFTRPLATIDSKQLRDFTFGNKLFNTNWVIAPASVTTLDGLGPLFNRVSCSACHLRDGRGMPPLPSERGFKQSVLRLSIAGVGMHGGPLPHPVLGGQLQDKAIPGVEVEGDIMIRYHDVVGAYADGTSYTLRKPLYTVEQTHYRVTDDLVLTSLRVAPAMIGLGLLEAIPEDWVRAQSDPQDADGDGISGRVNEVWSESHQAMMLGRFGWKANTATIADQVAAAAMNDIGITSRHAMQEECPPDAKACKEAPHGGEPELSDKQFDKLVFYSATLAPPARRALDDPMVQRGAALFTQARCTACHTPSVTTGAHSILQLAGQKIQPFSDLLLHDMGEGLADNRPDFAASGSEWRTAPLWGIGLVEVTNKHTFFLHDGRARNLEEAILWHGGEAEASKEAFRTMPAKDRAAMIAFLKSL